MSTRSLWSDDDEPQPRKRASSGDAYLDGIMARTQRESKRHAPPEEFEDDNLPQLLELMDALLHFTNTKGSWHARASGSSLFASGETPMEAMQAALKLRPGMKS